MIIENGIEITLDRSEEMLRKITELTKTKILVGIASSTAGRKSGPINNAMLGYIHQYGSPARNIPARPFLSEGVKDAISSVTPMLEVAADFYLSGEETKARQVFDAIGLKAQSAIKNKIIAGPWVPNSPATIARKKSASPLIDTGQLLNSITYVIRKD